MNSVYITGIGAITASGRTADASWQSIIDGRSNIGAVTQWDLSGFPYQKGAEVPNYKARELVKDRKLLKLITRQDVLGLAAADEAIQQSGILDSDNSNTGVFVGSPGNKYFQQYDFMPLLAKSGEDLTIFADKLFDEVHPMWLLKILPNNVLAYTGIQYGFKGPNHAVVTACSTGAHAIGDAARMIMFDDADVMVAGGAEAAVCKIGIVGFAQARALSTKYNDEPHRASRPWDNGRDGFVMGEGAGIVVLEELEHAKARGAKIYGEVVGYGMSGDAHHVTAPASDGNGGFRAMQAALKWAGMSPDEIDYVNAHGTSTPLGDEIELGAVKRLFESNLENMCMSSTKSSVGHLLGAAGAIEAIFCLKAIETGIVPPTLNLEDPCDAAEGMNLVPLKAQKREINAALSNSFGFGGTNGSLLFKRID